MDGERILLVTGKFPGMSHDRDGGSIMVRHLIDIFGCNNKLDILFTRTYNNCFQTIQNVNNVIFHPCKFRNDNKFARRILNANWNKDKIAHLIVDYDRVIIIHCCKAFGLENLPQSQIDKIILFPMFLSSSYIMSGELVPVEYTMLEHNILSKLKTIITPTYVEMNDLITNYNVPSNNITIIPRAINSSIKNIVRSRSIENNLIYIGSIKKQKQSESAIKLVSLLKPLGLNLHLHLVGAIQDNEVYERCQNLIQENNLGSEVFIHGVLSQDELVTLLEIMDINISVSQWETFGRGIIEGLASGLPTVVLNKLECLNGLLPTESGLLYATDIESMAAIIYKLCIDDAFYKLQSERTVNVKALFSIDKQREHILDVTTSTCDNRIQI